MENFFIGTKLNNYESIKRKWNNSNLIKLFKILYLQHPHFYLTWKVDIWIVNFKNVSEFLKNIKNNYQHYDICTIKICL